MPITPTTLALTRKLKLQVGAEADASTRTLAAAWVRAWDELSTQMQTAIAEVITQAEILGRWPAAWELSRASSLGTALTAAEQALIVLGAQAGVTISTAVGTVVTATAATEPLIIASQLPAAERTAMAARAASKILPSALDAIVARTRSQIVGEARALSAEAAEAMRRSLITGIATGSSPADAAIDMVKRIEGEFNGGLARAMTIARTELLDAYRTASAQAHAANSDVLDGWTWQSSLDSRCCPSCWAMNGRQFPLSDPGPLDHPNGRCSRVPVARSWQSLGIDLPEPESSMPDAQAAFGALPRADQLKIMGPARINGLKSGAIQWADLATRRDSTSWRPSYVPTPVRDLARSR